MSVTGYNANQFYVKDGVLTSDVPIKAPDFIGSISPPSGNLEVQDLTVNGVMTIVNEPSIVNSTTYNYNNVVISNNSDTVPGLSITTTGDAPIFVATDGDSSESFVIESGGNVNINAGAIQLNADGTATFTGDVTAPNIIEPGDLADLESKTQNINLSLTVPTSTVFQSIIRVNDNEAPSQTRIYMDAAYDTGLSIEARIVTENALLDRATIQDLNAPTLTSTDATITTLTVNDDINAGVLSWNNGTQTLSLGVGTLDSNAINVNTLITNTLQVNSGSLNMDSNRIINLAAPTTGTDATTRTYVDDAISTAGGGYQPLNSKLTAISSATATSGNYLRGDGTNFVSSAIQAADLPSGIDATKIGGGGVSNFEYGCLDGVTQSIQNQINLANQAITDNSNDIADNVAAISVLDTKTQALSDNGSILSISHPISMGTNAVNSSATPSLGGDLVNLTFANGAYQPKNNGLTTLAGNSGNTSQYVRGDYSLANFPTIPTGTMGNLNNVYNNCIYVSAATGNDSNNGWSEQSAVATLGQAATLAGNSGRNVAIFPGTYTENSTISALNLTITAVNQEAGSIVNFSGTITFSNASSSIRCMGIGFSTLLHTGNGALRLYNCVVNTGMSSSGGGYFEALTSDFQGTTGNGTVSISGSGSKVFQGCKMGILIQNNASSIVTVRDCMTSSPLLCQNGILGVTGTPVFAANSSSNAISVTGGSLSINDVLCLNLDGSPARINASSGTTYSISSSTYNTGSSTLSGTRVARVMNFDSISTLALNMNSNVISNIANGSSAQDAVSKSQLDTKINLSGGTFTGPVAGTSINLSSDCVIGGNLTVNGTTTTVNSVVNTFDGYLQIDQSSAGTQPALVINQGGGSAAIVQVTDTDSNIKFLISQDCDLAINTNKFTVDSATGDTVIARDCSIARALTCDTAAITTSLALPQGSGSTGTAGFLRYNNSLGEFQGYKSGAWSALGGGTTYSSYIASASVSSLTVTPATMQSPFAWNGSSSVTTRIYVYSDSGRTTQISGSPFSVNSTSKTFTYGTGNELPGYSTIYYLSTQVKPGTSWAFLGNISGYSDAWSNLVNNTITTPSNDQILANLTTSAAAYSSASVNSFVQITASEYNALALNITGASQWGVAPVNQSSDTSSGAAGQFQCYQTASAMLDNSYCFAFCYTPPNGFTNPTGTLVFSNDYTSVPTTSGFINYTLPITSSAIQYCVIKAPPSKQVPSYGGSSAYAVLWQSNGGGNNQFTQTNAVNSNLYYGFGTYSQGSSFTLPSSYSSQPVLNLGGLVTRTQQW